MQPQPVRPNAHLRQALVATFLAILAMTFVLISILDRQPIANDPTLERLSPTQLYEVLDPYIDKLIDVGGKLRNILH